MWRNHVRAWRASGETAASYCESAGLNPRTLSWWAWKLGKDAESSTTPARTATFIELEPVELSKSAGFELELDALTIRVPLDFEPDALCRLLDVLEARR